MGRGGVALIARVFVLCGSARRRTCNLLIVSCRRLDVPSKFRVVDFYKTCYLKMYKCNIVSVNRLLTFMILITVSAVGCHIFELLTKNPNKKP